MGGTAIWDVKHFHVLLLPATSCAWQVAASLAHNKGVSNGIVY
jgi:hypothetical protein